MHKHYDYSCTASYEERNSVYPLSAVKQSDFSSFIQVFVLVDLLFFPRLLFAFGVPVSLFVIFFSFLYRPIPSRPLLVSMVLMVLMLGSVLFGLAIGNNFTPEESLKRAIQLFTILLYSFIRFDAEKVQSQFVMTLRFFYFWVFGIMLLFFLHPEIYHRVAFVIYPESLDQLENNINILRFGYFFSDPNSAAYLICFTLVGYLFFERNLKWGMVCSIMAIVIILSTQSRGSFIAITFIFLFYIFNLKAAQIYRKFLAILGLCLVFWMLIYFLNDEVLQFYSIFEDRFDQEVDIGGGRLGKYMDFLENFNIMPIGSGYHLFKDGVEFRPHSDLIRINMSYGLFALPLLFYFVFPRRNSQLLLFVVFMVPFMINTVIDDYRLFGMYILLFGVLGSVRSPSASNSAK